MNLPRVGVDNSAMVPAYFDERNAGVFDVKRVTGRSRALVHAIRMGRVKAFSPPSFCREFLNVAAAPLDDRAGRHAERVDLIRAQWADLLSLPIISVDVRELAHESAELTLAEGCPPADSWYLALARQANATLRISHAHADGFAVVAARHVPVRLLTGHAPGY